MQIIKKFTAILIDTNKVNDEIKINLGYGRITGPYYDQIHPTEEFDTEEEAEKYAYDYDNYSKWLILPIIRFERD
jgi:hypothetical protein